MILRAHQQQLGHHIVCQHDVRRMVAQFLAHRIGRVPRILGEGHGEPISGPPLIPVLQLLHRLNLRIDQCIHGVDDQGRNSITGRRVVHQLADDRQEVSQALARTRTAGHNVALAPRRALKRLDLVLVEMERLSPLCPEDRSHLGPQPFKLVNRCRPRIRRTHLEQKLWPQPRLFHQRLFHIRPGTLVPDREERPHKVLVVRQNRRMKIEYAHCSSFFARFAPLLVRRYRCVGLFGDSGWVISTNPASSAG